MLFSEVLLFLSGASNVNRYREICNSPWYQSIYKESIKSEHDGIREQISEYLTREGMHEETEITMVKRIYEKNEFITTYCSSYHVAEVEKDTGQ